MTLNYQNIVQALLSDVFNLKKNCRIDKEIIEKGAIQIVMLDSSLNNTFFIKGGKIPLFLKQSFIIDSDRKEAFENEHTLLRNLPKIDKTLKANLPRPITFIDNLKLVAIHEFIEESETLYKFLNDDLPNKNKYTTFFVRLGIVLQKIHAVDANHRRLSGLNKNSRFPFNFYALENPEYSEKRRFWYLLKQLQTPEFREFIADEKKAWNNENYKNLIHRDFRLRNILRNKSDDTPVIIDWEMCGSGDGLWDVASLFFDNEINDKAEEYLDVFLASYLKKSDNTQKAKKKVLRYKILIKLLKLAGKSDTENSLAESINALMIEF